MENKYDNYEMFDKLIANNKKAQSWTIFWVTTLCVMAGIVLWMAYSISEKNKTISDQKLSIQTQSEFLEAKSRLIDSLVVNCNVAKNEIVKNYDSAIVRTENALQTIVNTNAAAGMPAEITQIQQNEIKKVNKEIQYVKSNIEHIKVDIRKPVTRLFIQYNEKEDSRQVTQLLGDLKAKSNYYVAPPEYIDNRFYTAIKFYNYRNDDEAATLKDLVAKRFGLGQGDIKVEYETNAKIKATVEIWIDTRRADVQQLMIKKQ